MLSLKINQSINALSTQFCSVPRLLKNTLESPAQPLSGMDFWDFGKSQQVPFCFPRDHCGQQPLCGGLATVFWGEGCGAQC